MTQVELAFRAEVNRGYISELESGKYSASVAMLGKLARALNVAPGAFLERLSKPLKR
jgi:transcriptional regulator with XRE-family HTH domain